jgi:universal stress protein E
VRRIRRILVAVKDPAAKKLPVVAKAAQLAEALGATLELFHALAEPIVVEKVAATGRPLADYQARRKAQVLAELEQRAATLRAAGIRVEVATEWDYPPAEAIVRRAVRGDANLVVAERHATKHRAAWLLTYTDWELVRLCPVPLLVVKSDAPWNKPAILAAIDPAHRFAKPARLDSEILALGLKLRDALAARFAVVHAYASLPTVPLMPATDTAATYARRTAAASVKAARERLDRALRGRDVPESERWVVDASPVEAIPESARRQGSSLVVMGAVSRSGLKSLFIGNTAERVLDALTCDVLVVKPAAFQGKVQRAPRGPFLTSVSAIM